MTNYDYLQKIVKEANNKIFSEIKTNILKLFGEKQITHEECLIVVAQIAANLIMDISINGSGKFEAYKQLADFNERLEASVDVMMKGFVVKGNKFGPDGKLD